MVELTQTDEPWWRWCVASIFGKRRVVEYKGLHFVVYKYRGVDYVCGVLRK